MRSSWFQSIYPFLVFSFFLEILVPEYFEYTTLFLPLFFNVEVFTCYGKFLFNILPPAPVQSPSGCH